MIRHVILDIGGVLILKEYGFLYILQKKYKFRISMAEKLLIKLNKGSDTFGFDFFQYVKTFNKYIGSSLTFSQFQKMKFDNIVFNKELIKFCKKNKKIFKTSIFSDNGKFNVPYLKKYMHTSKWIYKQLYSCEYGVGKSSEDFFKILLKKLNAKPEECIYIDDVPEYVKRAKKFGMHTVCFQNNKQLFKQLEKLLK